MPPCPDWLGVGVWYKGLEFGASWLYRDRAGEFIEEAALQDPPPHILLSDAALSC